MKKLILLISILFLLSFSNDLYSQTNNAAANYIYAEGFIKFSGMGKHKDTDVNFGSKYNIVVNDKNEIIDKAKEFETGVDLMNYMSDKGWECFNTQIILSTNLTFYVYNFRKLK